MYKKPFFIIYKLIIITKKQWLAVSSNTGRCVNFIQANLEKEN